MTTGDGSFFFSPLSFVVSHWRVRLMFSFFLSFLSFFLHAGATLSDLSFFSFFFPFFSLSFFWGFFGFFPLQTIVAGTEFVSLFSSRPKPKRPADEKAGVGHRFPFSCWRHSLESALPPFFFFSLFPFSR